MEKKEMVLKIERISNGYILHEPDLVISRAVCSAYYPDEAALVTRISFLIERDMQ